MAKYKFVPQSGTATDAKAAQVNASLTGSGFGGISPAIIIAIITLLINLFKECNLTAAEATERAKNPRRLDRLRLRRLIKQHGKKDREELEEAFLQTGVTEQEMVDLYQENAQAYPPEHG